MITTRLLEEDVMYVVTPNGAPENEAIRAISVTNAMLDFILSTVLKNFILYKTFNVMFVKFC